MAGLYEALGNLAVDAGSFRIEAPEGWTQGRTLYGGMTAALCAHAVALTYPGLPPLRSAQFTFVGPASGGLRFRPEGLRRSSSTAVVAVDCLAEDALAARGVFTHASARVSEVAHDLATIPEVPGPAACEPFFGDTPPGGFFQNFDMRLAAGARPRSQGVPSQFTAWVRHRDDEGVEPVISLLALADSLPPAATVAFSRSAAISTMTWSIDLAHPIPAGEWFLLRSTSEQCADGYSQQAMEAWSMGGTRVAAGRQTVAIFI